MALLEMRWRKMDERTNFKEKIESKDDYKRNYIIKSIQEISDEKQINKLYWFMRAWMGDVC